MIENSDTFDWYEFYEMGCLLLEKGDEKSLRTAINRFYYASFCRARDYLIKNDLFFETGVMHEDELWVPQVVLSAQKIRCIPVTVYRYRIREGSLTNPAFEDRSLSAASMVKIYPELFRALESILKDDPFLEKVEAVFAQRYLYMIYKYRIWRYGYGKDIDKKMLWRTSRRFKDKLKVLGLYVVAG